MTEKTKCVLGAPPLQDAVEGDVFFRTQGFRILTALRRISRAFAVHSRKLDHDFHVTAPQMLCLYCLDREGPMTQSRLADQVSLGVSTITGIMDRLEAKNLVRRERSRTDRRMVIVTITDPGRDLTRSAPALLQDRLASGMQKLPPEEQRAIAEALERVVELLGTADPRKKPTPKTDQQLHNKPLVEEGL